MSERSLRLVALLFAASLMLVACGGTAPADVEESLPLGFEPVTHNDDWEPVTQDFDGVQMALVPAGCFMMGSSEDEISDAFNLCEQTLGEGECDRVWFQEEAPRHEVCFDEPFWIDVYEVTNAQFGSAASDCTEWSSDDDQPRICVDWNAASDHCEARGARLPTEAEWEYVARGPDGLVYPWGDDFVAANVVYQENSEGQTAEVGSRPGGVSWVGSHDVSGNVWEWTADWFGTYPSAAQVNPSGPIAGDSRVLRGGSWDVITISLRSTFRGMFGPGDSYYHIGFRCARDY